MTNSAAYPMSPRRVMLVFLALAALLLLVVAFRMAIGGLPDDDLLREVLLSRLARVRSCVIVGVALATSGVALQVLLRNPLAEPFILGLSTGAGVGVIAQSVLAWWLYQQVGPSHLGALLGAAASMLIVYAAARRRGVIDPLGLLLVGVVLSTINGALIMLLNYVAGPGGVKEQLSLWMMGYISESVDAVSIWLVAAVTGGGLGLLLYLAGAMDVATFSDTEAQSLGVNLTRLRTTLFLVASVLAAGAVVLAGPIAFVGLVSPHLTRLLIGPSHRTLLV
ncbi:MAG: iron ABC transporter permease, partial [Phycisphaeraceae bacterium]